MVNANAIIFLKEDIYIVLETIIRSHNWLEPQVYICDA